jgi:hypothetical protein
LVHEAEHRAHDLLKSSERQMRLRLDAAAGEDTPTIGPFARRLEEGGLSDAGFAGDDQDAAARRSWAVEQLADPGALQISPVDHVLVIVRSTRFPIEPVLPSVSAGRRRKRSGRHWALFACNRRARLDVGADRDRLRELAPSVSNCPARRRVAVREGTRPIPAQLPHESGVLGLRQQFLLLLFNGCDLVLEVHPTSP